MRDDVTGQLVATSTSQSIAWTIPARAATEAPHGYTLEVSESGFFAIRPDDVWSGGIDVFSLLGATYVGTAPYDIKGTQCVQMLQTAWGPMCQNAIKYWAYTALDQATLSYQPFVATITTGIDAQQMAAPRYIAASALTSGPVVWDSGDDDLPGPL